MSGRTFSVLSAAAWLAVLAGCQTPSSRVTLSKAAAPVQAPMPADPSFDWHVLVIAPFGSMLKDVPRTLHEVLLFHDQDPGAAAPDDGECYAADTPAPQFVGHVPDEYLLCFKRDRLYRIQATVRLSEGDAAAVFAAACAGWLKSAAAPPAAQDADACEGRDAAVHFRARLEGELNMTLDGTGDP